MSCCTNTLDLGCVGACEAFELPIKPSVSELWTIELTLLGITLTKEYQTTAGQSILINISEYELNENTCIIINVKNKNGNINFYNLMITHYTQGCELKDFIFMNKGRFKKIDELNYEVANFVYEFNDLNELENIYQK